MNANDQARLLNGIERKKVKLKNKENLKKGMKMWYSEKIKQTGMHAAENYPDIV